MKRLDRLQEDLNTLPTFTLSDEQKENIKLKIKKEAKNKKRVEFLKPAISIIAICSIAFFLFIASNEDSRQWIQHAFQPTILLTAPEGKVFTAGPYEVLGVEDKVGLLVMNHQFIAEDPRRNAKIMLYFWGTSDEVVGNNYRVEAMNRWNELFTLAEGTIGSPMEHTDVQRSVTSFLPFPSDGEWQLSFYVENQLFGEFTHTVLPPLPKTQHYTLTEHPLEIPIGDQVPIGIYGTKDEKEIVVKLVDEKGKLVSEEIFIQHSSGIDATTLSPVYYYEGQIKFPKKGKWFLEIDGEKSKSFTN